MKSFIKMAMIVLLSVLVLGPVFAGGGRQQEVRGRTLSFSMMAQPDPTAQQLTREYYMEPIRRAFPNDTINFIEWTDRQVLQIQVAGGGGPNIIHLDGPTDAVEFARAGRVIELDAYATRHGWKDVFFDWAYNSGLFNNRLYSIPDSFEGMLLFVNRDVFSRHNIAVPTNIEQLEAACRQFQSLGVIPISFGNSDYQGAVDWLYSTWITGYAGPPLNRQAILGQERWNHPNIADGLQQMVNFWQNGWIGDRRSQAITMDDAANLFATGRAAMMVNGTWLVGDLLLLYPDCNWETVLMPELRPGVGHHFPLATGGAYTINANTPDKDFAAEVLNWMFTDLDWHIRAVREANFQPFPVRAIAARPDTFRGLDNRLERMYEILFESMRTLNTGYCSWTFYPSDVRVFMNDNTDALFLGRMSVADYLARVQALTDVHVQRGTLPAVP